MGNETPKKDIDLGYAVIKMMPELNGFILALEELMKASEESKNRAVKTKINKSIILLMSGLDSLEKIHNETILTITRPQGRA